MDKCILMGFRFWISDIWNKSRVSLPTYPAYPTYQQIGLERQLVSDFYAVKFVSQVFNRVKILIFNARNIILNALIR